MPTILNVIVDAVVYHWDSLVAELAKGGSRNEDESTPQQVCRIIRERDDS